MTGRVETTGRAVLPGPFVRLPPGRRYVATPVRSRREAMAGLSLVVTSTRSAVLAQAASWLAVAAFGPQVLPGTRAAWQAPFSRDVWDALAEEWRREVGAFDAVAVYERPQVNRDGVALLLLRRGRPLALVKARCSHGPVAVEVAMLRHLAASPTPVFHTPRLAGSGEASGWEWLALEPLPPRPLRPSRTPPMAALLGAVRDAVAAVLPRNPSLPEHWEPFHGDLTPWNLRLVRRRLWLLDWEDAGWAPPGADEVYFRAVLATMGGPVVRTAHEEAVHYWVQRAQARAGDADRGFNIELEAVLHRMNGSAGSVGRIR